MKLCICLLSKWFLINHQINSFISSIDSFTFSPLSNIFPLPPLRPHLLLFSVTPPAPLALLSPPPLCLHSKRLGCRLCSAAPCCPYTLYHYRQRAFVAHVPLLCRMCLIGTWPSSLLCWPRALLHLHRTDAPPLHNRTITPLVGLLLGHPATHL